MHTGTKRKGSPSLKAEPSKINKASRSKGEIKAEGMIQSVEEEKTTSTSQSENARLREPEIDDIAMADPASDKSKLREVNTLDVLPSSQSADVVSVGMSEDEPQMLNALNTAVPDLIDLTQEDEEDEVIDTVNVEDIDDEPDVILDPRDPDSLVIEIGNVSTRSKRHDLGEEDNDDINVDEYEDQ